MKNKGRPSSAPESAARPQIISRRAVTETTMIALFPRPSSCALLLALGVILTPSNALAGASFKVEAEEFVVTADSQLRFWEGTFDVPG